MTMNQDGNPDVNDEPQDEADFLRRCLEAEVASIERFSLFLSEPILELLRPVCGELTESFRWLARGLRRCIEMLSQTARAALAGASQACLESLRTVDSVTADALMLLERLNGLLRSRGKKSWSKLQDVKTRFEEWAARLRSSILPTLQRFARWLGQTFFRLLTPKEWKVRGGIGAEFLGLANASIEITFGYDPSPSQSKPASA